MLANKEYSWETLYADVLLQRKLFVVDPVLLKTYDQQWHIEKQKRNYKDTLLVEMTSHYDIDNLTQAIISNEIKLCTNKAQKLIDDIPYYTIHHAGLSIMNLFIIDLLGKYTAAAKIFQNKFELDYEQTQAVSYSIKVLALIAIFALDVLMIYYTLLKAYVKGYSWQWQFLWSYIFQFVTEILLFETLECIWLNIVVPLLIHEDVKNVLLEIKQTLG